MQMPMFSRRPAALAHISDEAAAKALSRHFGDFVQAACELNISRTDLRRLTWANPSILDAAHERMQLFIFVRKDEIISGLHSRRASDRRRAVDRIAANPGLFGDVAGSSAAFGFLVPAERGHRSVRSEHDPRDLVEQETAAEQAAYRERERLLERERDAAASAARDREAAVDRRASAGRVTERSPAADSELWPSNARYAHVHGGLTRRR